MGFFENLAGLFTGSTAQKAAEQARATLEQAQTRAAGIAGGAQTTGLEALRSGMLGGTGAWETGMGTARGDISGSIPQAAGALTGYGERAGEALRGGIQGGVGAISGATDRALGTMEGLGREGIGALRSGVAGAVGGYDPLERIGATYGGRATEASDAIRAALGLGGGAPNMAAFSANPAYQFNLTQGLEAINRARAARGEAGAGGNIDRAAQEYGAGLASGEFKDYMSRLAGREALYAPYEPGLAATTAAGRGGAYMTGAGREADVLSSLGLRSGEMIGSSGRDIANLLATGGGREAELLRGTGTGLADVYSTGGKNLAQIALAGAGGLAGLESGYGTGAANLLAQLSGQQLGLTGQLAPATAKTYMDEAAAKSQGAQNLFNLLGQGATFAGGQGWFGLNPKPFMPRG